MRNASKYQYLVVVGAKPFPANQNFKYECFQWALKYSILLAVVVYMSPYAVIRPRCFNNLHINPVSIMIEDDKYPEIMHVTRFHEKAKHIFLLQHGRFPVPATNYILKSKNVNLGVWIHILSPWLCGYLSIFLYKIDEMVVFNFECPLATYYPPIHQNDYWLIDWLIIFIFFIADDVQTYR